jgi:hypothetical protein
VHRDHHPFFGSVVATPLVRAGEDAWLPNDRETGKPTHTLIPVYREMLLQICRDYPGLPDPRTLSMAEVRFFYEGLRGELREHTKPRPKPRKR